MPQFTQREKEQIKEQLLTTARKLFATKGLKKTSLEELTSSVGIAKSSFYIFFESKEVLYLELLDEDGPGIEERVWTVVNEQKTTQDKLKSYLHAMTKELEENPLMKRLQTHPEEIQLVARKVSPEFLQRKTARNIIPLIQFLEQLKEAGQLIDEDIMTIVSFMRAAMTISRHKEDIGEEQYPKVAEMMFDAISKYITI
ncbi:transcriptional regulator, TetR family [Seinonella peptonophila]|uniref:Transcriptional regulator, TetR family n=1 Tax=Seinonella peptonophila TaxID=112248 RepID=A0A1M4XL44_9BACL|nr:TetR/AcrR family transcriptional regulator [Seinonella peptonophila]SHE94146.1 transcriptional regulator, TetR family [Seinonella peptonophila]